MIERSLKVVLTSAKRVDPEEMHFQHFIWVFTVFKNNRLGVFRIKMVNSYIKELFSHCKGGNFANDVIQKD